MLKSQDNLANLIHLFVFCSSEFYKLNTNNYNYVHNQTPYTLGKMQQNVRMTKMVLVTFYCWVHLAPCLFYKEGFTQKMGCYTCTNKSAQQCKLH